MIVFWVEYENRLCKVESKIDEKVSNFIDNFIKKLKLSTQKTSYELYYNSLELKKDYTFKENNVGMNCCLKLKMTKQEYVFIRKQGQENLKLMNISLAENVDTLYKQCAQYYNITIDSFTLYFKGTPLDRNTKLQQYQICENSTINCELNQVFKEENILLNVVYEQQIVPFTFPIQSLVQDLENAFMLQMNIQHTIKLYNNDQILISNETIQKQQITQDSILVAKLVNCQNDLKKKVSLSVIYESNPPIEIQVQEDTTIKEIEKQIIQQYNLNEDVTTFYNEKVLITNKTVKQYLIKNKSTLIIKKQKKINLNIQMKDQNIEYEVDENTTAQNLIEQLIRNHKINKQSRILFESGHILKIDQSFKAQGVNDNYVLFVAEGQEQLKQNIQEGTNINLVINYNGYKQQMEFKYSILVSEVIQKIQESFQIQEQIQISLGGNQNLDPNDNLSNQNVQNGSLLYVISPPNFKMKEVMVDNQKQQQNELGNIKKDSSKQQLNQSPNNLNTQSQTTLQINKFDNYIQQTSKNQPTQIHEGVFNRQNSQKIVFVQPLPPEEQFRHSYSQQNLFIYYIEVQLRFRNEIKKQKVETKISIEQLIKICQNIFQIDQDIEIKFQGKVQELQTILKDLRLEQYDILDVVLIQQLTLNISVFEINNLIDCKSNTKILDLMDVLKQMYNITAPTELIFNHKTLQLNKSLEEENIQDQNFLTLNIKPYVENTMKIIQYSNLIDIYILDGINIFAIIQIESNLAIQELEKMLWEMTGINCRFQFNMQDLNPLLTFDDYGIKNNDQIYLIY